jgi:predicted metal-dependent hydrolase
MTLEIVWRNPSSPPANKRRVEQIVADEFGAIYAVRNANETITFELILRRAA